MQKETIYFTITTEINYIIDYKLSHSEMFIQINDINLNILIDLIGSINGYTSL